MELSLLYIIISTIIFYIILKYFFLNKEEAFSSKILFYTALLPIFLYGLNYLTFNKKNSDIILSDGHEHIGSVLHTELMSESYPITDSISNIS